MKSTKIFSILLCLLIICSILFTACGEQESESTKDESTPDETTVVLETTSDGGTIEQDSEGNKITKDENGKVVSVEDKDGNPVNVTEYLTTHTWVESNGGSGGSGGSSGSGSSSVSGDDAVEESIPVIIATIPDEDDMVELPDL